ncbi:polyadenylate-binding protein 2 isoform X1 [Episyrphus balteatus]|uniref:polyadenylate-binding protein 2 isoform X1 n=1 Tax=Episyrphus balteatus TaxID=286459 RepID=UPI0024861DD4|nr:polyadenylate-binding protein 2 isoform X1 [Episyrphus balteatus]XP_055919021.1 polyadenylate-binding protein 2 isoform X1 [Eupeodes corollae]XP_055919022.1 polyadenylate-binding protein 2 isoform X1 [Eupeodes corollae]
MADEDLSLNEDQLLDNLDDANGESEILNEEESNMQIDPELEAIKARVKEMEEEAEKIKQMQSEVDKQMAGSTTGIATVPLSIEEKQEIDTRSVYVGNVDYGASAEELESHFHGCGTINRVTILCNKADGHPKGFAYIEFGSKEFVETALAMNETLFRGRQIKVMSKRTNRPGLSTTNRFSRGSFRGRGARVSRACCHSTFRGARRPIRGYRGRANYYAPY